MNHLREYRRQAHLTQRQLAKRAGITSAAISYTELGKSYPWPETRKRIAAVLHIEQEAIFGKPPLPKQRPLVGTPPQPSTPQDEPIQIKCRWCHGAIVGLIWNPAKYELIVKRMPRSAKVHSNGSFYHESCLKEKVQAELAFSNLVKK